MPHLSKKCLSQFVRTGCLRRLRLDLYPATAQHEPARQHQQMPRPKKNRPGISALTMTGREWEHEVFDDLIRTFGQAVRYDLDPSPTTGQPRYRWLDLKAELTVPLPGEILLESSFDPPGQNAGQFSILNNFPPLETFLQNELAARGEDLSIASTRPDIVVVSQPVASLEAPPLHLRGEIRSDGTVTEIQANDPRRSLRIIDVKMTSTPSAAYLCEVAWYGWAMAAWLEHEGLSGSYFVSAMPGVWPGSHTGSAVVRLRGRLRDQEQRDPTPDEAWAAVEEDVETFPVEMFLDRVRAFFEIDVVRALEPVGNAWRTGLPWHVSSRCIGCDWLGYEWFNNPISPDHCWGEAQARGHLSRIPGVTRGAAKALTSAGVTDVSAVASTQPNAPVYETHHMLQARRTAVHARANALQTGGFSTIPRHGTSAVLPRWSDVNVFLRADFDIATGLTFCFAFKGRGPNRSNDYIAPVTDRSLDTEARELVGFLRALETFLRDPANATVASPTGGQADARFQIYLWDELTLRHLERVIGRHLPTILADPQIRDLAWLFPPEDVLADPALSGTAGSISVVSAAVDMLLAADIPHHYSLLEVANAIAGQRQQAGQQSGSPGFRVAELFRDPLSDQVPSERAHELWTRFQSPTRNWHNVSADLQATARTLLNALEAVTYWARGQLRGRLTQDAPSIGNLNAAPLNDIRCADFKVVFAYAQLNAAIQHHDIEVLRALPTFEREARFQSVRILRRLTGVEEQAALQRGNVAPGPNIAAFETSPRSRDAKLRDGAFTWSLLPEALLDDATKSLAWHARQRGANLNLTGQGQYRPLGAVFCVTVEAFDRNSDTLIVDVGASAEKQAALSAGIVDLSSINGRQQGQGASLDPWPTDFFLPRLRHAMQAIGNPPVASTRSLLDAGSVLHRDLSRRHRQTQPTAAADFVWDISRVVQVSRVHDPTALQQTVQALSPRPTPNQETAIGLMLTRRLSVLWGPPGTGKSLTAALGIATCLLSAQLRGEPLRVLVCGPTWIAIREVFDRVRSLTPLLGITVDFHWLNQSEADPGLRSITRLRYPNGYDNLCDDLNRRQSLIVVGATPQQTGRLAETLRMTSQADVLDLIVVDEGSQVDLAHMLCLLQALAVEGAISVIGDDLQMPPIHQAEAPIGLENVLGSVFAFYTGHHAVQPMMLDTSFRSNAEIIEFVNTAGYVQQSGAGHRRRLSPNFPDRRLLLRCAPPTARPPDWPAMLPWSSEFAEILDPEKPLVAIRHSEGASAQSNELEAQWITALAALIARCAEGWADGGQPSETFAPGEWEKLFGTHLGIVTPHRAQMSRITALLERVFPNAPPATIRSAVDTVERYQGQERTVILASMAVGDPDAVAMEEEFLFNLQRFNVTVSRARAKLVVMLDDELWRHLPNEAPILEGANLLKRYAGSALPHRRGLRLEMIRNGQTEAFDGEMRWR